MLCCKHKKAVITTKPLGRNAQEARRMLEAVEKAVDEEIGRIIRDGVTEDELEKAKQRYVRSMVFAKDSPAGMANIYGATLATGGTVEDVEEWPDRIRAVTAEQVKAVAAKYLNMKRSVAAYLLPAAPQNSAQASQGAAQPPQSSELPSQDSALQ